MKTMNAHKKLGSLLSKAGTNLSLILALLVMSVLFAIMSPHFLTLRNLVNIATYTSINAIMAFGITVAMILAAMDLSQYTVAAVSGMVMALMLRAGLPTGVAIVCALLTGVLLGLLNGVLVSICGVNPIIATLGTQQIYRGFAYLVSNGKNILISNDFLTFIGRGDILGVPVVVLLMIVMFAITAYVLKYTSFGRKIYAIGGNKNASYLSGINIRRVQMGGFVYCSVAGALGGILLASQVGVALPTCGIGSDMDVIASVVLGGVSLSGGCGKVSSTLLGALILQTIGNGMTLLSVQSYWQMVIKGIVLILAVLIDVMRSKKR